MTAEQRFIDRCESAGLPARRGTYTLNQIASILPFELSTLRDWAYGSGQNRSPISFEFFPLKTSGAPSDNNGKRRRGVWGARRSSLLKYEASIIQNIGFSPRNHKDKIQPSDFQNKEMQTPKPSKIMAEMA